MTNAARAKVWDAAYEPFGRSRVFTSTVEMNLRLPGQQLHAETGLHQNWMRDYDPMVGRYLQPVSTIIRNSHASIAFTSFSSTKS